MMRYTEMYMNEACSAVTCWLWQNHKLGTVLMHACSPCELQLGRNEAILFLESAGPGLRFPVYYCRDISLKASSCRPYPFEIATSPVFSAPDFPSSFLLCNRKYGRRSNLFAALRLMAAPTSPEKSLLRTIMRPEIFAWRTAIAIFQSVHHYGPFNCD